MTLNEIQAAIINTNLSNDDLNVIMEAVAYKRSQLGREVARSLRIGSQVKFTSTRDGRTFVGTLDSIKIKNATVLTAAGRYRVPLNMLTAA